jgi:uncharacterized protein YlxP (DUF503 family)
MKETGFEYGSIKAKYAILQEILQEIDSELQMIAHYAAQSGIWDKCGKHFAKISEDLNAAYALLEDLIEDEGLVFTEDNEFYDAEFFDNIYWDDLDNGWGS